MAHKYKLGDIIRGGFSAVKSQLTFIIGQATINAQKGWKK